MNLAARKYNFIQAITTIDESLLEKLELLLNANKDDWHFELSIEEKEEILTGINQANNDEFINHNEIKSKFAKWH